MRDKGKYRFNSNNNIITRSITHFNYNLHILNGAHQDWNNQRLQISTVRKLAKISKF